MPGELGWFGIWPRQANTDGLQLDEIEYLMCKSLGYDVPISLETGFGQMESHPLTPGILEIVRLYEDLRMNRRVDDATRALLREKDKDFAAIVDGKTRQFVPVTPLATVAGGTDLRGEIGPGTGHAVQAQILQLGDQLTHGRPPRLRGGAAGRSARYWPAAAWSPPAP